MYSLISDDELIKDPNVTKKILERLTTVQNKMLDNGQMLLNPINGDMIVLMMAQNEIARIIVNVF